MKRFRGPGKKPKLLREEKLAKRRAERKPLTPLQQAENKIRCMAWAQKQIEAGLCTQCTKPATHGLRCETHWFGMIAYSHKLTPHVACVEMLKQLWQEQDGRCALTGEKMIVGHKIARANGGTNSKENLHWVLYGVNAAKADMTLDTFVDTFVEMCRQVATHAENKVVPLRKV